MCVLGHQYSNMLIPPLRLVLNSNCNGNCPFCHHEGNHNAQMMASEMVYECASVAERMKLPHIALTGGEPTLRQDLGLLISGIQERFSGRISLTTNGYGLERLASVITKPLDTVNLSIVSFKEEVYTRYQNVNPHQAIDNLLKVPAHSRNLNVVMVNENVNEIPQIIEICKEKGLSIHLMFELREISDEEVKQHSTIIQKLLSVGESRLEEGSTPRLVQPIGENITLSIKHPFFSRKVNWTICANCKERDVCYERVCAVRVYSTGKVTPCLSGYISSNDMDLHTSIYEIYQKLTIV